jgi:serine/threonine protein kinase/Tol biopolymer transport system component
MTTDSGGPHTELAARLDRGTFTPLSTGSRLAHYRIDGELGRGGMGVVYRATDTKLHRPVAIKLVSDDRLDAATRRRFKREAEIASGLNHPHIVTVYDVAEHGGYDYIVSELVEGATLDAWAAEPRSLRQKLELMIGVADALTAAHAAGILHRDIKPGNILVSANGYAKLADFGLAVRGNEAQGSASRYTAAGLVVGTVAYMSPEQTAGHKLDERSDVFSFGVVLYELFAGRHPFAAPSDLAVLKSISEAPHPALPETLAETLRATIDKALEKDPADRYQSMRELAVDLRRVARKGFSAQQTAAPVRVPRRRWSSVGLALTLALAAALVPAVLYFRTPEPTPARAVAFDMTVPSSIDDIVLSPNGETLAYEALGDAGELALFVQPVGSSIARAVRNTERASGPFWSADDQSLVFTVDTSLKRVDVAGTVPPRELTRRAGALGGAWARDDTILFTSMARTATGGTAIGVIGSLTANGEFVARTASSEGDANTFHYAPVMLPDGRRYLFVDQHQPSANAPDEAVISLGSLDSDEVVSVVALGAIARTQPAPVRLGYADGWLFYTKNRTLLAQRFDTATASVTGEPVEMAENVDAFSVAGDVLAYRGIADATSGEISTAPWTQLRWYARNGAVLGNLTAPERNIGNFELSPDGRQLAAHRGSSDLYILDVASGVGRQLTFTPLRSLVRMLWSPDSSQIVFSSGHEQSDFATSLYRRAANGSGNDELLHASDAAQLLPFAWSGGDLLFSRIPWEVAPTPPVWRLRPGERVATPIMESRASVINVRLSPDGHWLAYATDESGVFEVVVQPYPNLSGGKWPISEGGGREPRWRADGKELFFVKPNGTLASVVVDADASGVTFRTDAPIDLFQAPLAGVSNREQNRYVVDGDGQKFLMLVRPESTANAEAGDSTVRVVVNWQGLLATN